jgi:hypothetical protein
VIVPLLGMLVVTGIVIGKTSALKALSEEQRINRALFDSHEFRSLQLRVKRPAALLDSDDGTFVVFELGENFSDHFVGLLTIRVDKRSGKVFRQRVDQNLEHFWCDDSSLNLEHLR